jgi:hypothetical protein
MFSSVKATTQQLINSNNESRVRVGVGRLERYEALFHK